ncbi:MAG: Nif3-like dinuclear metal center hexameric protein, partial [Phycisphaerae bacterium]|nr:Nif3-like dinuclear metal center hexameric protein [Phycisphaerae bacterium]
MQGLTCPAVLPAAEERVEGMKVKDVVRTLEAMAPPQLAADWDNVGLLVGDGRGEVKKLLLCVDLTEEVLAEASAVRAQMVMAYHPVIFKPISRLTAADTPVVYAAAKKALAVYSVHTALDAAPGGTNDVLADALALERRRPLEPISRPGECKVVVFVPHDDLSRVAEAAFNAGAGRIGNYYDCAFFCHGIGTFCGGVGARPSIGQAGQHEAAEELRLEVFAPKACAGEICAAIRGAHSYETPVIDVYPLAEYPADCGMGRVGRLSRPATVRTLIARVKKAAGVEKVSLAAPRKAGSAKPKPVSVVACCAGSCGSLFRAAADAGAEIYVTGEMRHHDALAATAAGMTVVCMGHSNSERFALAALAKRLKKTLPKLSVA